LLSVANQVKAALTLSDNIPEISRRFSKDGIKVEGADMGDRSLADIPAELAARAAAIQPGQTSELIPARDGIHVLKLLDRKASDKKVMVE
ncbi:peptidylprolyl isomerase, partial [Pseudomonas syringae]